MCEIIKLHYFVPNATKGGRTNSWATTPKMVPSIDLLLPSMDTCIYSGYIYKNFSNTYYATCVCQTLNRTRSQRRHRCPPTKHQPKAAPVQILPSRWDHTDTDATTWEAHIRPAGIWESTPLNPSPASPEMYPLPDAKHRLAATAQSSGQFLKARTPPTACRKQRIAKCIDR